MNAKMLQLGRDVFHLKPDHAPITEILARQADPLWAAVLATIDRHVRQLERIGIDVVISSHSCGGLIQILVLRKHVVDWFIELHHPVR